MGYKWKPSKTARREFAQKIANDSQFAADYYARKDAKADKRRATSKFDYNSAGGEYLPTKYQYDMAIRFCLELEITNEQQLSCQMVISAYSCQEKAHHDHIHIVNELIRSNPL